MANRLVGAGGEGCQQESLVFVPQGAISFLWTALLYSIKAPDHVHDHPRDGMTESSLRSGNHL